MATNVRILTLVAMAETLLGVEDNCIPGPAPCVGKMGYLSPATMLKSLAIFERAAKLHDNPELTFRLAWPRLSCRPST
jgi:hypothetical protein